MKLFNKCFFGFEIPFLAPWSSINADVCLWVGLSVGLSPFDFFQLIRANAAWTIDGLIYLMMLINYL